ncbi:FGGY family carbohydrate kinase [Serratia ureilytica]
MPLDADGNVLHSVKLWCDTETAEENERLLQQLGGANSSLETLGLRIATGYTASKILGSRRTIRRCGHNCAVLLPHDYLNFWLTGERVANMATLPAPGCSMCAPVAGAKPPSISSTTAAAWQALPPLKARVLHRHGAPRCRGEARPRPGSAGLDRRRRQHDGGHRFRQHRGRHPHPEPGHLRHAVRWSAAPSRRNRT